MPDPDARTTLIPAALLAVLNGAAMLLAPHVDQAPLTGTLFEVLRWSCVAADTWLLGLTRYALTDRHLPASRVRLLWPMTLSSVLPTAALYLAGHLTRG